MESSPRAAARVPDAIAEELSTGTRTPDSTPHASRKNSRELFAAPQVQVWGLSPDPRPHTLSVFFLRLKPLIQEMPFWLRSSHNSVTVSGTSIVKYDVWFVCFMFLLRC
jgi:hypothetical protein